jgi:2-polyprenyl-3-methyl-5-hydroxy-6-metoxy-1,4-benzoquinol methylase
VSSERQLLVETDRWWGEHVHRYREALRYIKKQDVVLDIACGTGFGTDIIASHTSGMVTGGDIDQHAIEDCRRNWKMDNISFEVLDGTCIPYATGHFDIITSFETIEHTTQYAEMVAEFARILKPTGRLILSTPNSRITSPDGKILNPFHTQEFNYEELLKILSASFRQVELYGQRYCRYDAASAWGHVGKKAEKMFLGFGVRKLPLSWRSRFMKRMFGYPLYSRETDFTIEKNLQRIQEECPVLYAICQK